jgi:hypothetical protein
MATYFKGYITGNKTFSQKAVTDEDQLGDVGFNPPVIASYHIISIQKILRPALFTQMGDVEIIAEVALTSGGPPQQIWYVLRKYGREWARKISFAESIQLLLLICGICSAAFYWRRRKQEGPQISRGSIH